MSSSPPSNKNMNDSIDYYNQNADKFYQQTVDLNLDELYEPFLKRVVKGGRILDAGCGSGRDSWHFLQLGYDVTAFDASEELRKRAETLIRRPVFLMKFEEMDFDQEFDGVWACASLLHVRRTEIEDTFNRLAKALKHDGILYLSFKLGDGEVFRHGRWFNNYSEDVFRKLVDNIKGLEIETLWVSQDSRPGREDEKWLNGILRKAR